MISSPWIPYISAGQRKGLLLTMARANIDTTLLICISSNKKKIKEFLFGVGQQWYPHIILADSKVAIT